MSECTNGKEALAMILKKEPDLIISDIMMPEMDGLTLCKNKAERNHQPYTNYPLDSQIKGGR